MGQKRGSPATHRWAGGASSEVANWNYFFTAGAGVAAGVALFSVDFLVAFL